MASADDRSPTDMTDAEAALLRWRLIVGPEPGGRQSSAFDAAEQRARSGFSIDAGRSVARFPLWESDERSAGLGGSSPYVPTWLGEIRRFFPTDVVAFMEKEAIERKGLRQLLLEPETLAGLEKVSRWPRRFLGSRV